jgi:cyclopropane fatty-acyl-phospholipid synthase-like methyltransferase
MKQKEIWDKRYSNNADMLENVEWIKNYSKYFNMKKGCTIVDLGCGRGSNSIYLEEQGFNIIACDFSPVAIKYINETYPSIQTRCFDMTKEFPDDIKNIGIVLASLSTHYFSFDDTIRLYNNIRNMLEPMGYFVFRVNSKKEFENKDKEFIINELEKDYYVLNDGNTKRYFDIHSISALLREFLIIEINETTSGYHGKEKHFIEGIAQKITLH